MTATALALLLALPAARAQDDVDTRLERTSQGLRSGARELDAALSRLDDMTAGYAAGTVPPDAARDALRAEASKRSNALWELRNQFWSLDSNVRMAHGADAIGRLMLGKDAGAQTLQVLDSEGAEDLGAWTKSLCDRTRQALEREDLAHRAALDRASALKLRLWAAIGGSASIALLLGVLIARRPGPYAAP